jgi:hypothetical protein
MLASLSSKFRTLVVLALGASLALSGTALASTVDASPSVTQASVHHKKKRCSRGRQRAHGSCKTRGKRNSKHPATNSGNSQLPATNSGGSPTVPTPPSGGGNRDTKPTVQAAVDNNDGWTNQGIITAPVATTTDCLDSPTASGNGVTNNGNGRAVHANYPNAPGAYVRAWLYIYYPQSGTAEWVAGDQNGAWIGPLAPRQTNGYGGTPTPYVDWHVNAGHNALVKVLWELADTQTKTLVGAWAPTQLEFYGGTQEWCPAP